jgi:hypothetical protein
VGKKLKVTPLLLAPCQLTTTGPEPASPLGAFTTIFVLLQLTIWAGAPLNVTTPGVLVPKPVPVIVTCVAGCPLVGLMLVIDGANSTFNVNEGEDPTALVTTTGSAPVLAVAGTVKVIALLFHETIFTDCPLSVTVPALDPKLSPTTVIVCPAATFCGLMLLMVGAKLKLTPLLFPFTTTGPEPDTPFGAFTTTCVPAVLQETIEAVAPLKVTVPGLAPNPVPVMVTCVPGCPEVGLIDVTAGAAHATDASRTHARINPSCDRREMCGPS